MEKVDLNKHLLAGFGLALASAACGADDDWQADRLLQPTAAQLAAERRGAVVIYDGLEASQVNYALDHNFERIQSMMFVRTRHPAPPAAGGGPVVEDDGCD